jgi:hypothetical protein
MAQKVAFAAPVAAAVPLDSFCLFADGGLAAAPPLDLRSGLHESIRTCKGCPSSNCTYRPARGNVRLCQAAGVTVTVPTRGQAQRSSSTI